jgi:tetrapyrrole methylase family protein / MazG family protein
MDRAARTLVEVMEVIQTLRSPDGCPWDRKQTPAMVKNYLTEELYELLDAIDGDDAAHVAEETGDVLFLLLFLARMYEEQGAFNLTDSLERIRDKMIHRHPHVFGSVQVDSAEQVVANWQKLKVQEGKKPKESILDGLPSSMPALSRACALTRKAARVGFDWPDTTGVFAKIREELSELEVEINRAKAERIKDEIGDILFSIVNLARHLNVEPEEALRHSNEKFRSRFSYIEQQLKKQNRNPESATLEEMDLLWEESKKR